MDPAWRSARWRPRSAFMDLHCFQRELAPMLDAVEQGFGHGPEDGT